MTSREYFENKWFYMKYIGKYISGEILLARECRSLLRSLIEQFYTTHSAVSEQPIENREQVWRSNFN
jgi:hypothetical protein